MELTASGREITRFGQAVTGGTVTGSPYGTDQISAVTVGNQSINVADIGGNVYLIVSPSGKRKWVLRLARRRRIVRLRPARCGWRPARCRLSSCEGSPEVLPGGEGGPAVNADFGGCFLY